MAECWLQSSFVLARSTTFPKLYRPAVRVGSRRFVYNACMSFRTPQGNPNAAKRSRTPPPEDTFEEAAFLKALGEKQKSVAVKLMDGQIVQGWIEYYDKNMVRLTREGAPNLFIFKHEIMYITEDGGKRK
jgi:host factor-I protein